MADRTPSRFGGLLRSYRQEAALTQEELAERTGLAVNAISSLERGVRRRPYPHTVRTLADALQLDDVARGRLVEAARPGTGPEEQAIGVRVVGREVEAEHVATLLARVGTRLVTLTGPGGVGKTTLARAVVRRMRSEDLDEHVFVDASRLSDPARVVPTLARELGLPESNEPATAIAGRLVGRRVLAVLDNLEHLLDCAPTVAALVEECPGLRVLATSRAALQLRAETEVVVAPLPVPDDWGGDDPASVAMSPAVQVFLERCAASGSPLELTADTARTVAELCRQLEGLPLALELVAAQARAASLDTLLARLDRAVDRDGPRDLPDRQRTLTATLDWSRDLLDEAEQVAFAALPVFRGGFSLAAAEAVLPGRDAWAVLTSLTRQSLVVTVPGAGSRFRLLEPVRQYADRLPGPSLVEPHAAYFLDEASRSWTRQHAGGLAAELDAVDLDEANHRRAHGWLLEQGRDQDAAHLARSLALPLALRGHAREWRERLDLHANIGAEHAVARGLLDYATARLDTALLALEEGHATPTDDLLRSEASLWAALASLNRGDTTAADRYATTITTATPWWRAAAGLVAGQRLVLAGGLGAARERLEEVSRTAEDLGDPFLRCISLNMRATVSEREEDLTTTARLLLGSVEQATEARTGWPLAFALPALAGVAMRVHQPQVAARMLGAAATYTGSPSLLGVFPASRAASRDDVAALQHALGDRFEATVQAGRVLPLDDLLRLARSLT